jgi:hypothetical protein
MCVFIVFTGMCLEKRVFYRAVSGLHSSINIHLCSKYLLSGMCNYTLAQLFLHESISISCCMKQMLLGVVEGVIVNNLFLE